MSKQGQQPTSVFMSPTDPYQQLRIALEEALGGSHGVPVEQMRVIKEQLSPTWKSLPKTLNGNVDRPSLCYVVHRFFKQAYGINIAGLDPKAAYKNKEELDLLGVFAPDYVHTVLRGETARQDFSIEDGVAMILMIEHLVADSVHWSVNRFHSRQRLRDDLRRAPFIALLESWLGRFFSPSGEIPRRNENDRHLFWTMVRGMPALKGLISGTVKSLENFRDSDVRRSSDAFAGKRVMQRAFSVEDAQSVGLDVVKGLSSFWQSECQEVTQKLAKFDTGNTGRVPISKFYQVALAGDWRFSESLAYLEQQGALDNSSSWQGPRVIIANYIQSSSNCIVTKEHYSICCRSSCEGYWTALEEAIGAPSATPEAILSLVGDLLSAESDGEAVLSATLRAQLRSIADVSTGKVWLHGRLFAQWLHYVFPYDCPFPHLAGTAKAIAPNEFGTSGVAKLHEMRRTTEQFKQQMPENGTLGEDWMTMWSHEEELVAERVHLRDPWDFNGSRSLMAACLMLLALLGLLSARHGSASSSSKEVSLRPFHEIKEHLI